MILSKHKPYAFRDQHDVEVRLPFLKVLTREHIAGEECSDWVSHRYDLLINKIKT